MRDKYNNDDRSRESIGTLPHQDQSQQNLIKTPVELNDERSYEASTLHQGKDCTSLQNIIVSTRHNETINASSKDLQ